jgi:hypothetical protein
MLILIPRHGVEGSRPPGEASDCTVLALSVALHIPYDRAWELWKANGRKDCAGADVNKITPIVRAHQGPDSIVRQICYRKHFPTLEQFSEKHSSGVYLCYTEGHIASVVDGTILDYVDSRRFKVKAYWRC